MKVDLPLDLKLEPDEYARLMEVRRRQLNENTRLRWDRMMALHKTINYDALRDYSVKAGDICASQLVGKSRGPAIVLGSGPSLDEAAEYLRAEQDAAIFAHTSQLDYLEHHSIEAHYLTALDVNPEMRVYFKENRIYGEPTGLTHPCVDPVVLNQMLTLDCKLFLFDDTDQIEGVWERNAGKQRFRALEGDEKANDKTDRLLDLRNSSWSTLDQGLLYAQTASGDPWIRWVLHRPGSTTNANLVLAAGFGYDPIYLVGYDLCYFGERRRYSLPGKEQPPPSPQVIVATDSGLDTTWEMASYANIAISFSKDPQRCLSTVYVVGRGLLAGHLPTRVIGG